LALLIVAARVALGGNTADPNFFANERGIDNSIAESPADFIAGIVEVVKRCEQVMGTGCLDRVRIIELIASRAPHTRRRVGDTLLLYSGPLSPGHEPSVYPHYLLLATPLPKTTKPAGYGAKVMGEAPTEDDVRAFTSAVNSVIRKQGV
jgi:hypothetical protein